MPEGHPFAAVKAYPLGETSPEIWMLGSSDYGAQVAAHFGLPYAFAWFFTDGKGGPAPRSVPLPAKYRDPQTSGLKYTVAPDATELHIHAFVTQSFTHGRMRLNHLETDALSGDFVRQTGQRVSALQIHARRH